MTNSTYPYTKLELPYDYISLVPYYDPDALYWHYLKIYGNHVDMLNYIIAGLPELHGKDIQYILSTDMNMPINSKKVLKNYAGAVFNHSLFFQGLNTKSNGVPIGNLATEISEHYGSFSNFKNLFIQASHSVFGSGWIYLISDGESLKIVTTVDNNVPMLSAMTPILVLDVWEHSYFCKYKNDKTAYVNNWFNIIDWEKAEKRYNEISQS